MPETPRNHEDGASRNDDSDRVVFGQQRDLDLSIEHMKKLVAVGVPFPRARIGKRPTETSPLSKDASRGNAARTCSGVGRAPRSTSRAVARAARMS